VFLPGAALAPNLVATRSLSDAVKGAEVVVCAAPSHAVRVVFQEIAPRLRGLRNDPAVKELLADPAAVAMIQNGDTLGLLAHPKFRELVSRLSAPAQPQP